MQIPESEINKTVATYWTTNQGWDWSKLIALLPADALNALVATILCEEQNEENNIGWRNEIFGGFTVSLAYEISDGVLDSVDAAKWNAIWKLKVPSRIKTFLWLVKHGKIMTNSNRARKGQT